MHFALDSESEGTVGDNGRQKVAAPVTNRATICRRVGLLGTSVGIVLGLTEAACLRLSRFPLELPRPHVPFSFWFFAPLMVSVAFGLLGLLAGLFARLSPSRLLGEVIVAVYVGLAGGYLGQILKYYPSSQPDFVFLKEVVSPEAFVVVAFACALGFLWFTRKPDCPIGALIALPIKPWSLVVIVSTVLMMVVVGITHGPDYTIGSTAHASARSQRPNFILIISDATRADHLSSYGYARKTTPNLEDFARHGVLFENAISASSWTLPAIASMMTNLLPHQHGASADHPLAIGPRTLPEILAMAGYETAGFSANPYFGISPWGLGRGYETYTDSTAALGYSVDATRLGHEFIEPLSEALFHHSRFAEFNAHQLNQRVYHWLDHRSERPFFLCVHYNDAHDSYEVPSPYDHTYGHVFEETKQLLPSAKYSRIELTADQRQNVIAAYDDSLRFVDAQVGELLRFVQNSPDRDNTYIIFTSDHGEAFGEHHSYTHGWDLYREVLHVPLMVAGPRVPAGLRVRDLARTRQIFPTVLEMAGLNQPVLRRSSLSRMWKSDYTPHSPDEPTVSELIDPGPPSQPRGMISLTTREWHLIYYTDRRRNQLYHWPTDPLEQHDVAELPDNQALRHHLESVLLDMVRRSYRPWRDTRYLEALSDVNFLFNEAPQGSTLSLAKTSLLPAGPGVAQALFSPNPEDSGSESTTPEDDMLRSLPYGSGQ